MFPVKARERPALLLPEALAILSEKLVCLQVEASLLWYFQVLLEHSGDMAGLQGAILSTSGDSSHCCWFCHRFGACVTTPADAPCPCMVI